MRNRNWRIETVALWLCATVSTAFGWTATFQGVGDLPGGELHSSVDDVSGDGLVVVGFSASASGYEAYRWTKETGMAGLGTLPGGDFFSHAYGVSVDGSVVVGGSSSSEGYEAFRWTESTGMDGLGDLAGGDFSSSARAVSGDGSVVVGRGTIDTFEDEAFRWTSLTGIVSLGDLPGGVFYSGAYAVSADGSVVVGSSESASGEEPFRWTEATGLVGLGSLPGGGFSGEALGVSADGSVIVGQSSSAVSDDDGEAFRWTESTGMVGLGNLDNAVGADSFATDVSGDGSIVVGASHTAPTGYEAFIWDETNGMRSIKDILVNEYGLDLTGWTLRNAMGISDDGVTIVGVGYNPSGDGEGWIATIPRYRIYYVDDDAAPGGDGSSWANAYKYLQDALADANSASKPVKIRVAKGTYKPDENALNPDGTGHRGATFQLINDVTLKGGYAGRNEPDPNARDIRLYETMLSGDLTGNDGPNFANNDENCYHVVTGSNTDESAVLEGFIITGGNADGSHLYSRDVGGGMFNNAGSPTILNCIFIRNSAREGGGGMKNTLSNAMLINCTFSCNYSDDDGGAGMGNFNSNPFLFNCTFYGNITQEDGAGMLNYRSNPTLINCTFAGNDADDYGGAIWNDESDPILTNCILWGNGYDEIYVQSGTPIVTYCDVQGGWPGEGNIAVDPCFVQQGSWDPGDVEGVRDDDFWVDGDYHLKSQAGRWDVNEGRWTIDDVTSPCIDAGDPMMPIGLEAFPNGGIVNMGAYGGTTEASKSYFGGPPCETIVAGDINGDCVINFLDFRLMALHWCEDNNP